MKPLMDHLWSQIKFCTSIHFVENQLFPSLIGISPLITIHYKSLLRLRIRSSSFLSKTFNLIIISSRRFRVYKNLFEVEKELPKGALFLPRKSEGL